MNFLSNGTNGLNKGRVFNPDLSLPNENRLYNKAEFLNEAKCVKITENIRKLCPSIYTAIRNSYKTPSDLFIDKRVIKSQEGTTQGDPIALAMYGVATIPLIDMLEDQNLTH